MGKGRVFTKAKNFMFVAQGGAVSIVYNDGKYHFRLLVPMTSTLFLFLLQ